MKVSYPGAWSINQESFNYRERSLYTLKCWLGVKELRSGAEKWNYSKTQSQDQLYNCSLFHEVSCYVSLFVCLLICCLVTILKSSCYKGKSLWVTCEPETIVEAVGAPFISLLLCWITLMSQLTSNCQYLCLFPERLSPKPREVTLPKLAAQFGSPKYQ